MRKLTYWVVFHKYEGSAYSFRAKTKRECEAMLDETTYSQHDFEPAKKVSVEYNNVLDLVNSCLQGEHWESR